MTGRQLYDRYSFEMIEQGVEVDEWEDLDEYSQAAWDGLAEWLNRSKAKA